MLYFKAISCPFEHEEKQFVFINTFLMICTHVNRTVYDVIKAYRESKASCKSSAIRFLS